MKIIVANADPKYFEKLSEGIREILPQYLVKVTDVKVEEDWVEVGRTEDGKKVFKELRPVVSFNLEPFPDDYAMQVLTTAFSGSNLELQAPDIGFCWIVG